MGETPKEGTEVNLAQERMNSDNTILGNRDCVTWRFRVCPNVRAGDDVRSDSEWQESPPLQDVIVLGLVVERTGIRRPKTPRLRQVRVNRNRTRVSTRCLCPDRGEAPTGTDPVEEKVRSRTSCYTSEYSSFLFTLQRMGRWRLTRVDVRLTHVHCHINTLTYTHTLSLWHVYT